MARLPLNKHHRIHIHNVPDAGPKFGLQAVTMLKSTYKPSANSPPPLLPGWTEHKAPTGHTYYYNAATKTSTYTRPSAAAPAPAPMDPSASFMQHNAVPNMNLSDPRVANAFMSQYNQSPPPVQNHRGGFGGRGGRGGAHGDRPRPQPTDKPRSKVAIPGCEPWILVYTKCQRRFAYNPVKNASYWRIPEKLMPAILELDRARIRDKASFGKEKEKQDASTENTPKSTDPNGRTADDNKAAVEETAEERQHDYDSSEYEEVEVTDDEEEGGEDGDEHATKRQRVGESAEDDDRPVEFSEADIAFQLQAMGQEYGLDPGEYDDGHMEEWPEGAAGIELSEEDAKALFKDLLNDYGINPYSPWEKLIEEGKVIDDSRYTVLSTTKARREVWEEWSREKIKELREQRARQEKKDPRIPYLALLHEKATPKLYWPEFKRKYKKEQSMKDSSLSDKDREKLYREHINRLKLPQATLKTDLANLLKSAPVSQLNNKTLLTHLPPQIITDIRYISLDAKTRDALVEALIQTLPPPPEDGEAAEDDEATQKALEMRRKREKALQDRERAVEEEKRRQEKNLRHSKALLRDGERELQAAMDIGNRGLHSQLERE
ncbi:dna replication protein 4 [Diaporthe amygdali]|uniref:dna replication protein 4 n=1 Tax=Phomopsis amygdali TaxID=1214568 RepID=UPI0022FDC727|nr:dna replication protein 4 [Diaporthe amygdali]KAJ0108192.1 dna replication protein 4 [Diaporthe amygdali]